MNPPMIIQNQLLATKFFVPVTSHPLILRPRLLSLLYNILKYPLTLLSAPAGFGKTMLLSAWTQSLPASHTHVAWVSLDEEDNEPRLFWTYVLSALDQQEPERFTSLFKYLQSPQTPPLIYVLTMLSNLMLDSTENFLLILDDYHLITEQEVHSTLSYLVEHSPPQLHIILATRADPPLPLALLRTRQQLLEIRTDQLRCTAKETRTFFHEIMDTKLLDDMIPQVTARTEGWLVGLQLLGLSLQKHVDPTNLLEEASGDQRYILDYLTQEVLQRQPQEVQTFLLSTCILEQLTAPLCDAVLQQVGSQQILEHLEHANVFMVSLDNKRQWYRYHALFAETLRYQLEQMHADLLPILHYRASRWYAQHDLTTKAILHAFQAQEWQWATDLIEQKSRQVAALTWGASEHELGLLRGWLEQLPVEAISSQPHFCLACCQLLWAVVPLSKLEMWLNTAEIMLVQSLTTQTDEDVSSTPLAPQSRQKQENQLGDVIAFRVFLQSYKDDAHVVLPRCQRALALLPEKNAAHVHVAAARFIAYYTSSANDVVAAIEHGLQGGFIAQETGLPALAIASMGMTGCYEIGAGRLHETEKLAHQTIQLGKLPGGLMVPDVGWPMAFQAEILREWNQLDTARALAEEAVSLCQQITSIALVLYILCAYAILLRVCLSCGDLDAARSAWQEFERIGKNTNRHVYLYTRSLFTTTDQVRLWLACGELNRATHWIEAVEIEKGQATPFEHERREVACARILLAKKQPVPALQRLEPALQRATMGQRWNHVIEIRLLQALAYQMHHEETQALSALSEAIRLAEPEGYIRSFVDEGASMEALLGRLREQQCQHGPPPYVDTLLSAFPRQSKRLVKPLSKREREVLQLLAHGTSNEEIAQELLIVIDTVKHHISRIFSKLGVQNREQAVKRAKTLGLLG